MELSTRLKEIREREGMSRQECADKLLLSYSALSKYETGERKPDIDILLEFSKQFGITLDQIVNPDTPHKKVVTHSKTFIPILGTIRAGIPIMASDNFDGELDLGKEFKSDFALRITGDSMSWAGIHDGDLALLRHTEIAQNGDIVAAGKADGDWTATLKYYIKNNGSPLLRAANPDYEDIQMDDKYRIIGVLEHVIKDAPDLGTFTAHLSSKEHLDTEWNEFIAMATSKGMTPGALKGFMEIMQLAGKK